MSNTAVTADECNIRDTPSSPIVRDGMEGEAAIPVDSDSSGGRQRISEVTISKTKALPNENGPHPVVHSSPRSPGSPTTAQPVPRYIESRVTDDSKVSSYDDCQAEDKADSSIQLHDDYFQTTSIPQDEAQSIALYQDTQAIPNGDDDDTAGDGLFFGSPDPASAIASARSIEEDHTIILHRSSSVASKSSNTKYKCLYCSFTFVGGPQKIRVHLTGKRENGTRLSRCENCPEDVRRMMENRMRSPRDGLTENGNFEDEDDDDEEAAAQSLPPRNTEENHCIILARSSSALSKSSNTRYKCIYCRFKFVGGPQKIRVHLTGHPEGGTKITKCPRVPQEVVEQMGHRRKVPKVNEFSSPTIGMTTPPMPNLAMASQQQPQQMSNLYQHQQNQLQMQLQQHHQQQLQQHQLHQMQMHQQHQMQQHHQQHQLQQMQQLQQLHMVNALPAQQLQMQSLMPVIPGPHQMPMFSISMPNAHAQMLMQQQLQQQYGMAMNPLMHSMQQQQLLMQQQQHHHHALLAHNNASNISSNNSSNNSNDNDSS